ncbi:MAG: exosome complex protein Rrp4 [Nanoarchaeota archaeon]|nr:exosome complex protein Rrp4 [Nanoarchaeota archaeon]MBU1004906.1 exosome complex protein Rrp4 [Nanoarchaeota archaeon]MBU1946556.1 exosome complex protein Rrp4 [Nanoarchaeota archaeon]
MSNVLVNEKDIVVPGETLAEGMDNLPGEGTYRQGEKILAGRLGLAHIDGRAVKLIPLSGKYNPKRGDTIICKVTDINFSGWRVDTNSAYSAMLSMKDATSDYIQKGADLTQYYSLGEYMVASIVNVTSQKLIDVTMKGPGLHKLKGGRMLEVSPYKVPRIIGKQGSMVSMIKTATNCRIIVGQNGLVWIQGEPDKELLVVRAIKKIEEDSHLSGLTENIKKFLEAESGVKLGE